MKLIFGIFSVLIFHFAKSEETQKYVDWNVNMRGIIRITNKDYNSTCVGTLIHSEWIITSAVCAIKNFREEMRIIFRTGYSFNEGAHIENTFIHPEFSSEDRENDIALIKLAIPADQSIRTLKIPNESTNLVAKKLTVVKWSTSVSQPVAFMPKDESFNISMYGYIYNTNVVVLNNKMCEEYPVNVDENRLCSYGSIACEGDEGSPLITNCGNNLVGVISVSEVQAAICNNYNCLMPVTTYTSVVPYRPWIKKVTLINIL